MSAQTGTLIVAAFFLFGLAVASLIGHACPAKPTLLGRHDWLYFGAAQGTDPYERYWDRRCVNCGLYD